MVASIVIPIGPYHISIANRAIESAIAQTVPITLLPIPDGDSKGTGWARNQGLAQVKTPFVLFLDADDYLEPQAVEAMLATYRQGHYVYCDDWQGESLHQTPDKNVYLDGTWHTVTTLVPTAAARFVGGFDERLHALEDLDFFLKLMQAGVWGIRCPSPLVHYTKGGERSRRANGNPDHQAFKQSIHRRYFIMSCCGGTPTKPTLPGEESKQVGDILAVATYTPRQTIGPATGRTYPKPLGRNQYTIWVSPRDVQAAPDLWAPVRTRRMDPEATPDVELIESIVQRMGA